MERSNPKTWIVPVLLVLVMLSASFYTLASTNQGQGLSENSEPVFVSGDSLYYTMDGDAKLIPGTSGDIVSGVEYEEEGDNVYLIYQDYSIRWGNVRYMEYTDGKWSSPITVGHDYADMVRDNGRSYIISSDMGSVIVSVVDGGKTDTYTASDSRAIATSIGVADGTVTAFWADVHGNVYSASASDAFSAFSQIYHTDNSIYSLSMEKDLLVVERDGSTIIDTTLSRSSDGWQVTDRSRSSSDSRGTSGAEIDDLTADFHARQNQTGRWVLIVYLNGDNNLGDNGGLGGGEYDVGDLNEMESVYTDDNVGLFDIVVLWDHKGSDDSNTHVLWLRHDDTGAEDKDSTDTVKSPKMDSYYPLLNNDGDHELYLSNYNVFVDFTEWVVNNFPAEHYFVDMWDHGGGYDGVIWDDDAGGDSWGHDHITLGDMHDATLHIHDDIYPVLGRTMDIIAYDTCLTNHGGIQYHNKLMFDYVGASEHTEGGYGWSYDTIFSEIVQNQGQITADKQAYNLAHEVNADGGIVTYAVVNTTLWDYEWMPAYNALAQSMKHKAGSENSGIKDAFSNSEAADGSNWKTAHDYWDMINNHIIGDGEISDSDILYWANRCVENMTRNTGAYSSGKLIPYSQDTDTSGVKLMMADETDKDAVNGHVNEAWIFKENQWDEMINQVDASTDVSNVEPTATLDTPNDGDIIAKSVGNVTISGTAADSDGAVQKVQLKIDRGYWFDVSGTDSWSYTWDINNVPCGWHHIMARSYDGTDFSKEWPGIDVKIIPNSPPTVTLDYPSGGEIVSGSVNIQWTANDPDADPLTVDLYYSRDGGASWNTISTGESDDGSYLWDTTALSDGVDYMVKVQVTDTVPQTDSDSSAMFSIDNTLDDQWYLQVETSGTYGDLSMEPVDSVSEMTQATEITGSGAFELGSWVTHTFSEDMSIDGSWTFNVWGKVTDGTATGGHLYAEIYSYDGNSETLLYTTAEDDEDVSAYESMHLFSWTDDASGTLSSGDAVVVRILLDATSGSTSSTAFVSANGESSAYGTQGGDYTDTATSDDTYETLTEMSGGTGMSILSENFDGGSLPAGWTIDNRGTGGGWAIVSGSTSSGSWAYDDSDAAGSGKTQNDYLISPLIDCGTYTTVSLSFYQDYKKYQETSDEGGFVDVSNDGGNTWTNVYHIYDTTVQETRNVDITSIAAGHSQVQIRWHYLAGWDYHWGIDDVSVTGNRPSLMEHQWTFDVADGGTDVTFEVEAYHNSNTEGDDFGFYYSTDGTSWNYMLTVTKTADDNAIQTYSLPSDATGTVYIKAQDTNRDESNGDADSLYVDYMTIEVTKGAPRFVLGLDGIDAESNVIPTLTSAPSFDIPVHAGWNLISYPLAISGAIEDVLNDDNVVWDYAQWYDSQDSGDHWKTHVIGRGLNDLGNIDNTMGIWIHVTDAGDGYLTVTGTAPTSTTIQLHAGWNLVSYPASSSSPMNQADLPVEVTKISAYNSASTYLISSVSDWGMSSFEPGSGYWLYSTADTVWTVDY